MQLFIKTIFGKLYVITISKHCTLNDLKYEIYKKSNIEIGDQILIYSGNELKGNKELIEYEINDHIRLMI
uniref:Ubiquitin n=1 Tax=Pithovirus LCDPAC02 TaxID=2506601 RepID=A0A481YNT3_9VIRU|nr:MAG: ubiquitin [Pithovirus LCDPAC02]